MHDSEWSIVIKPKTGWLDINLKEISQYRNLILMLVKRNLSSQYKQTILGPLWYLIQPILTTVLFTIIFGRIANVSTEGVPQFLFFMSGNIAWLFFSTCLTSISNTFAGNAVVLSKVYFPRLIIPISTVIFSLIIFASQLLLFICFLLYYYLIGETINPNLWLLAIPLLVLQMSILGMGFGIIISSLTTKYRDLAVLVSFGVQLWMYVTPVVYPASELSKSMRKLIMLNPMSPLIEIFRHAFLGCGQVDIVNWITSILITVFVLAIGVILFSRVEKNFIDTI